MNQTTPLVKDGGMNEMVIPAGCAQILGDKQKSSDDFFGRGEIQIVGCE